METAPTEGVHVSASGRPDDPTLAVLLDSRANFLRFLRGKVSDPELAEDILQDSLLKAIRFAPRLRSSDRLLPWFYSILRNAVTDTYRSKRPAPPIDIELIDLAAEDSEEQKRACGCFAALLPLLKPEYAELISAIDLGTEPAAAVAKRLDLTSTNLKVRHHRARQALRRQLERTCRVCAEHHCLDCTCKAPHFGEEV
jgi:RNA polymerase sigma-70 factor (ECF subfamily)